MNSPQLDPSQYPGGGIALGGVDANARPDGGDLPAGVVEIGSHAPPDHDCRGQRGGSPVALGAVNEDRPGRRREATDQRSGPFIGQESLIERRLADVFGRLTNRPRLPKLAREVNYECHTRRQFPRHRPPADPEPGRDLRTGGLGCDPPHGGPTCPGEQHIRQKQNRSPERQTPVVALPKYDWPKSTVGATDEAKAHGGPYRDPTGAAPVECEGKPGSPQQPKGQSVTHRISRTIGRRLRRPRQAQAAIEALPRASAPSLIRRHSRASRLPMTRTARIQRERLSCRPSRTRR